MTDRPILFSAPMIRALLDGRKTQTRRVRGLQDVNEQPREWELHSVGPLGYMAKQSVRGKGGATFESRSLEKGCLLVCPQLLPYELSDRLWVREAWRHPVPASQPRRKAARSTGRARPLVNRSAHHRPVRRLVCPHRKRPWDAFFGRCGACLARPSPTGL